MLRLKMVQCREEAAAFMVDFLFEVFGKVCDCVIDSLT